MILGKTALPARTLAELIAWLKQNPGKATLGTVGNGSATHVAGLFFQKFTDTHLLLVPYRGAAQGMQDLLGGQLDLMMPQATLALPQVRAGTIRAYAVMGKTRLAAGPDIPTVDEAGAPGLYLSTWSGLWVPKGTPRVSSTSSMPPPGGLGGCERARATRPIGPGHPAAGSTDPAGPRRPAAGRDREWWPIIKAAGVKAE